MDGKEKNGDCLEVEGDIDRPAPLMKNWYKNKYILTIKSCSVLKLVEVIILNSCDMYVMWMI